MQPSAPDSAKPTEAERVLKGLATAARWARSQYHAKMIKAAADYIKRCEPKK